MNTISKIECPECNHDKNSVEGIENHIQRHHCMFCGDSRNLTQARVLDKPDTSTLEKIKLRVNDSRRKELYNYSGGFDHVLINELVSNANQYVDDDGRLTSRENLEYHNIDSNASEGMVCKRCKNEYDSIVDTN